MMSRARLGKCVLGIAVLFTALMCIGTFILISGVGFDATVLHAPGWFSSLRVRLMWCYIGLCPILDGAAIVLLKGRGRLRLMGLVLLCIWFAYMVFVGTLTSARS
jgi:hypothetical protein